MLNLRSYMLDCRQCTQLFFLPEDGDAALERHGWQRHEKGGWRCPLCRARTLDQLIDELQEDAMDHASLDEIDRERAREAARKLTEYQTEVRRAHRRIILCLVGLSVVVGVFLYLLK